jgi:hypothetical protein
LQSDSGLREEAATSNRDISIFNREGIMSSGEVSTRKATGCSNKKKKPGEKGRGRDFFDWHELEII